MQFYIRDYSPPPLPDLPHIGGVGARVSPRTVFDVLRKAHSDQQTSIVNHLKEVNTLLNTGTQGFGPDLSATTDIVISAYQHLVVQAGTIQNILTAAGLPASHVTLIAVNAGFSLASGGNIAAPKTVKVNQAVMLVWSPVTQFWYPIATVADLSDIPDDPTNTRFAVSAIDINRRALIDLTQPGHIGQVLPQLFDYTALWQATHAYTISTYITDSNGNIQQLVTAGTSGASPPTWSTLLDGLTSDGSAVWENVGGSGAASIILQSGKYLSVATHQATPAEIQFVNAAGAVISKITKGATAGTDLSLLPATTATGTLALGETNSWNHILAFAATDILLKTAALKVGVGTGGAEVGRFVSGGTPGTDLSLIPPTNGVGALGLGDANAWASIGLKTPTVNLSGKIAQYDNVATVAGGIPAERAQANLPGQTAAIAPTTIYAVPADGLYRVNYVAKVTTPASVSSVLGGAVGFQIVYTDADDSVVVTSAANPVSNLNTTQAQVNGVLIANAKAGSNIQFAFDYTSVGTAMAYALHVLVEAL